MTDQLVRISSKTKCYILLDTPSQLNQQMQELLNQSLS